MDRAHLDALLARKCIKPAQHARLLELVERGIVDPCAEPNVTPALAQLWYKHAARLVGEGESITKAKLLLTKNRTDMRDTICRSLTKHRQLKGLDEHLAEWFQLNLGETSVDIITAVAWSWMRFMDERGGNYADTLSQAWTVAEAKLDPVRLMEVLHDMKRSFQSSRLVFDPCTMVDELALKNDWWDRESSKRKRAVVLFAIRQELVADEMMTMERANVLASVKLGEGEGVIDELVTCGDLKLLVMDDEGVEGVAPRAMHMRSVRVMEMVGKMLQNELPPMEYFAHDEKFTDEQKAVSEAVLKHKIVLCCAPAGTGKTTVAASLANNFTSVLCLAPTHKALAEMRRRLNGANMVFQTVASFYCGSSEERASSVLSGYDLVIVDEVSMVTLSYIECILGEFEFGPTRLLLLGDDEQLPCIGRGCAIRDLAHLVPTFTLTRIMRTGNMPIVNLSRAIRDDDGFTGLEMYADDDIICVRSTTNEDVASCLGITPAWCCDPRSDHYVQIITHTNADVAEVNRVVQTVVGRSGRLFSGCYVNDAVRITTNTTNYKNGMEGVVLSIDEEEAVANGKRMRCPIVVAKVRLTSSNKVVQVLDRHMEPLYASTVHKVQGSEYGIVALYITQRTRLSRELFYTAVTRAKEKLRIVGRTDRLRDCPPERRLTIIPFLVNRDD